MVYTCVDLAWEKLAQIRIDPRLTPPIRDKIEARIMELRFLKMFFDCFEILPKSLRGTSMINIMDAFSNAGKELGIPGMFAMYTGSFKRLEIEVDKRQELVKLSKPIVRQGCVALLTRSISFRYNVYYGKILVQFFNFVIQNLSYLLDSKAHVLIPRAKSQIGILVEKLNFFRDFVEFVRKCTNIHKLDGLLIRVQGWINSVACLAYLFWIDNTGERIDKVMENLETYFKVPKGLERSTSDSKTLVAEPVAGFVNAFLRKLAAPDGDQQEFLREGIIVLLTLLTDPPKEHAESGELISTPTDAIVSQATSIMCSLYMEEVKEQTVKERNHLHADFREKIDALKSEVRECYIKIPKMLQLDSPTTNGIGFVDSLLRNLKEMLEGRENFVPLTKYQVMTIQRELESLRPFLKDLKKLQNDDHEELKDLWTRAINVAYHTEHVINSFLVVDHPVWYNFICLSDVIAEITLLNCKIKKVKDYQLCSDRALDPEMNSSIILPAQINPMINEVVVGFEDEAETIINRLTRGTLQRDIVSIVGNPGQDKTTLAKKVYNHFIVQYHFHKCAWCHVSHVYKRRQLLLEILRDVHSIDRRITQMSDDELADRLRKCLKGHKYLIVMDDIWNIAAWHELKESFPEDNNGSRVLFKSRIHNISLQAKRDCLPHVLRPLSEEESLDLLKEKLQHKNEWALDMSDVGKEIVQKCKGLPLAIVVIGGLLARTTHNMVDWWKQISRNLGPHFASEGCMDILELSYKHLPDYLKPCFLYFGAFPEGKVVQVQKMIRLWIAEGFIQRSTEKCLEAVAEEYLMDLVDRSLVIVTKRSSIGGIKRCRVHDLFHHLCLQKATEENFVLLVHGYDRYDVSPFSLNPVKYDKYRLSIYTDWDPFVESQPTGPNVSSLLVFANKSWNPYSRSGASSFVHSFKYLKVLGLGSILLNTSFPETITSLVLLRYLEIWGRFKEVPSTIVNLQNLETFLLTSVVHMMLPIPIWKMKNLRHVDAKDVDFFFLGYVRNEEAFQISNVETLKSVKFLEGKTQELLRRLPRLRKLSCLFLESWFNLGKPVELPEFDLLGNLEALKVTRSKVSKRVQRDQFQALNLPVTLKKLTLSAFGLPWNAISTIGQLPNLEVLKLREDAFKGPKWEMEDEQFLNLKFLELYSLNIEEWCASCDPFPRLPRLVLKRCYKLREIPSSFGDISTLTTIEVYWCSHEASSSAWRILEEQRDMGNEGLRVRVVEHQNTWEINVLKSLS